MTKAELVQGGLAMALRRARKAKGFKVRDVQAQTGLSSISRIESGTHAINVRTLVRLAECYGRVPSDLLREAENRQLELPL